MSMVCPRCNTSFEERHHCPSCGIALVAFGPPVEGGSDFYGPKWQQSTWGRIVVGLMLAQGLYYGLWQLSTAAILTLVEESARATWWNSTAGWVVSQVLLAVSVFAGGTMAGAGQRRGALYGAMLGLINGVIFLAVPKDRSLSTLEMCIQPFAQMVFGMVGAGIGGLIWKAMVPIVPSPALGATPPPIGRLNLQSAPPGPGIFAGPVNWGRVILGTAVAVLGSAWANLILKWITSDTGFNVDSAYHAKFVTWEISALALLVGSGFAGSNSRSGAKQGLLVGLGVSAGLIGWYYQSGGAAAPAPTLIFDLLRVPLKNLDPLQEKIACTLLVVVPLAVIGGWFGGQLLPPLTRSRRKDRTPAWV